MPSGMFIAMSNEIGIGPSNDRYRIGDFVMQRLEEMLWKGSI